MKKLIYILMLILLSGLCAGILHFRADTREREHNNQVKQLEALYTEVQNDCNKGDYESALEKANQLYYTIGFSEETKTYWDNTRKGTIDYIENAMLGLAY